MFLKLKSVVVFFKIRKRFSKNPNTVKSTSFWLNVWETWCKQKNIVNKIEDKEPEKLNKLLKTFYAEVKTKTVATASQTA